MVSLSRTTESHSPVGYEYHVSTAICLHDVHPAGRRKLRSLSLRLQGRKTCEIRHVKEMGPETDAEDGDAPRLHAYELHLQQADLEKAKAEKEAAQEEWDAIPCVVPGRHSQIYQHGPPFPVGTGLKATSQLITFKEAWEYFIQSDTSTYMKQIKPTADKRRFSGMLQLIFGPAKMHPSLHKERDLVFAVAQCPLLHRDSAHRRVLQTLFRGLVEEDSRTDVPMIGAHWEQVGFQGTDPGTDLRGVGFLGLLQPLHLLDEPRGRRLARDAYQLSLHPTQHFPFLLLSLNVTRIALQALRQGCLNRECNRRREVVGVVNRFYSGVLLHIYHIWHTQGKTIRDSGYLLKETESHCKRHVGSTLRRIEQLEPLERDTLEVVKREKQGGERPNSLQQLEMQAESEVFI